MMNEKRGRKERRQDVEVNALIKAFFKKQLKSKRTDNKRPKSSQCRPSGT